MKMTFGQYLLELRKSKRKSQRDLANAIGVSFTYISKIENGVFPAPSEETLIKIAQYLNEDVDTMIMMANKVPTDLKEIITSEPGMPDFLRSVSLDELKKLKKIYEEQKELGDK
ncbi:helix-turn-helix domain-containing protein [uncultured Clostridium sp.]|uniref:helix-turn-helix domain-containing protein n=2 Tax=uncultured Clostridium sp. TaxID=59620 RepID=UPI00262410C5|nr:helix-turn-helix transcriptional regulator [uncultured Clostridium sp.]